jgi:hydroxyethylthiazole kinase
VYQEGAQGMPEAVWKTLVKVRERRPLVHNITNFVAMDLSANALLAIGASPAMIHAVEEAPEFTRIASALVVNIGTLSSLWVTAMRSSAAAARNAGKPWVLDPVGCGATGYRTQVARELAAMKPTLIRGNASEILALAGSSEARTRGVDSTATADAAREVAADVAREYRCIVGVTGAVDYVTDGDRTLAVHGSDELITRVTATGCALSSIAGAFLAVEADPLTATAQAFALFGAAAQRACAGAPGPGTARMRLLDELYGIDEPALRERVRIG